jgi:hypothetical protein
VSVRSVRPWACLGLVSAAAVLAYAPSFVVPFQFDDYARIIDNAPLQEGQWSAALFWLGTSRVLPSLTIIANYVAGGDHVFGYHLVNFVLHLIATGGVFVLAQLLCRAPRVRDSRIASRPLVVATVAALVMACHPLQTQAVTYIIQRAAVMSALFYVWAVVCYLRARLAQTGPARQRATGWMIGAGVLGAAALLSKENAVSLPLALLLTELVVVGRRPSRRALAVGAVICGALLLLPLAWKVATWPRPPGAQTSWLTAAWTAILAQGTDPSDTTPYRYLLTQFMVLPAYLRMSLLPWGLNVDHDMPVATGFTPPVVAGLLFLLILVGLGVVAARRAPLVGYGLLWIFVALSVESSVLPISDVMMEHRVYLAMPGIGLLVGAAMAELSVRLPRVARVAVLGIAAALIALTFARNLVWQSPVSLWLDAAEKSPRKARVLVNYGVALHGAGQLEAAARQYCRAIALDPSLSLAEENLELALEQQGKLDDITAKLAARSAGKNAPAGSVVLEIDIPGDYCPELERAGS